MEVCCEAVGTDCRASEPLSSPFLSSPPLVLSHRADRACRLSFYRIGGCTTSSSSPFVAVRRVVAILLLVSLPREEEDPESENKSGFPPSSLRPDRLYRLLRISTPLPLSSTSYTSSLVVGNRRYRCTSSTQTYTYTYIRIAASQGALFPRGENRACLFSTAIPRRFHSDPP